MSLLTTIQLEAIQALNLPDGEYAICGGAMLAYRDVRPLVTDVDILASQNCMKLLGERGWKAGFKASNQNALHHFAAIENGHDLLCEAFDDISFGHGGKVNLSVEGVIEGADLLDGVRWVRLEDMLPWKELAYSQRKRSKDYADIQLIKRALNGIEAKS